jgi:hypothetical protein
MECNQVGGIDSGETEGKLRRGVKPRLNCAFEVRIEDGWSGRWGGTAGGSAGCGAGEGWPEVEDGANRSAPLVSDLKEKEKGKVEVGRARVGGPEEERKRRRWAAGFWAKREGVKSLGFAFFKSFGFFPNLFKL